MCILKYEQKNIGEIRKLAPTCRMSDKPLECRMFLKKMKVNLICSVIALFQVVSARLICFNFRALSLSRDQPLRLSVTLSNSISRELTLRRRPMGNMDPSEVWFRVFGQNRLPFDGIADPYVRVYIEGTEFTLTKQMIPVAGEETEWVISRELPANYFLFNRPRTRPVLILRFFCQRQIASKDDTDGSLSDSTGEFEISADGLTDTLPHVEIWSPNGKKK
jgi:hypothetical protein